MSSPAEEAQRLLAQRVGKPHREPDGDQQQELWAPLDYGRVDVIMKDLTPNPRSMRHESVPAAQEVPSNHGLYSGCSHPGLAQGSKR